MKYLPAFLGCFMPFALLAQVNKKVDENVAALAAPYIPSGWKIIDTANGDLNKDGAYDIAVVIEDSIATTGNEKAPCHTRQLWVLFKDKKTGNYSVVAKNENIMPPRYSQKPDARNAYTDGSNVSIKKGKLDIYCSMSLFIGDTYALSYLDGDFRLTYFHQSVRGLSGDDVETYIDFLAKKKTVYTFADIFGREYPVPQTEIKKIEPDALLTLADLTFDTVIVY